MKNLKLKPPKEEILTEWPTWPFTRLTPAQVHYFELMQNGKKPIKTKFDNNIEEALF